VVTHPTTNSPACGLSTAERTGSPVFHTLWSYVLTPTSMCLRSGNLRNSMPHKTRRQKNKTKLGIKRKKISNLLESSHSLAQMPSTDKRLRDHRQRNRATHQDQLQSSVDLRDLSRLDFRRGQREVPVPGHSLRLRQRNPTIVDSRDSQTNIATEDDHSEPDYSMRQSMSMPISKYHQVLNTRRLTRKGAIHGETRNTNGHQ
jgi:hypothetical protein